MVRADVEYILLVLGEPMKTNRAGRHFVRDLLVAPQHEDRRFGPAVVGGPHPDVHVEFKSRKAGPPSIPLDLRLHAQKAGPLQRLRNVLDELVPPLAPDRSDLGRFSCGSQGFLVQRDHPPEDIGKNDGGRYSLKVLRTALIRMRWA